jgi:peptide deformylase
MSYKLLGYKHEKLTTACEYTDMKKAVKAGNAMLKFVVKYHALGLSANQVGIMQRLFVARIGENASMKVYINPQIVASDGFQTSPGEGCLSFPGVTGDVKRPSKIKVTYITVEDWVETHHIEVLTGKDAIIWCHEYDHLQGIRCVDKMKNKKYGDEATDYGKYDNLPNKWMEKPYPVGSFDE